MTHLEFATDLARQAGVIMKAHFQLGMQRERKVDNSPLTVADTAINQLVLDAATKLYPSYAVIAEEGSRPVDTAEYTWVCDPIDGTIPFSYGIPVSTFSLALVRDGRPIVAVVYDPFLDRLFTAELGGGAFCNGESIRVSAQSSLLRAGIYLSPWLGSPFDLDPLSAPLANQGPKIMNFISGIYASMLVAAGELTATIAPIVSPHDGVTIKLIVEEAGGRVTDLYGHEQRYDQPLRGQIASNGHVHDELVDLIQQHLKVRSPL